jgi:HlyD family secretion protein
VVVRRVLKWLVVLGVVGGLAALGVQVRSWWEQRSVPKYQTASVSRGLVESVVNSTGTVKPVQSVSVGAFTSGPIARVHVDFNSSVKKNEVLAEIDPRLLQAAVDRDRAAVASQEADLRRVVALFKQARNNHERAIKLRAINKDYLADTDLDQFRFTRESYEAQIELGKASIRQAEANLENSVANLGYTKIISPVDGIVIERKVDPGQTVAASFQTPELFIIAPDMDKHVYVFASVDEADIGAVRSAQKRGQVVKFTVDAYPGDLFEGKIHQVRNNSTTTQNVVTYPVVIEAPNQELKLMPGMTANLSFQIEARDDVLRVPAAALRFLPLATQVRPEDRHHIEGTPSTPTEGARKSSATARVEQMRQRHHRVVWAQDGTLLRAIPVTLGLIENSFAEVVDGDLSVGQALVTGLEGAFPPR